MWHPNGIQLHGNNQCIPRPAVRLPQPLPLQLLFHSDSSSFQGPVIPRTRRRGTAKADAPINVYQSVTDSRCSGQRHHTRV